VSGVLVLVLGGLTCALFIFTTPIARLALSRSFPANAPAIDSASLSPRGSVVIRGLVLHDTGALSVQTLVAASEIDAEFSWRELLRRKLRHVHVAGAQVHARSNASSQLSLANLLGPTTGQTRARAPLWIGDLDVEGRISCEPIAGVAASGCDWPMAIQMTMSGEAANPARQLHVRLGDPARASAFSLSVDVEAPGAGKPIKLGKLAVRQASFSVDAAALRAIVPTLPPVIVGRIGLSISTLMAAGTANLDVPPGDRRVTGLVEFDGVQLRVPGKSTAIFSVEDASGGAKFNTSLPMGPSSTVHSFQLTGRSLSATVEAATIRSYVAKLPTDLDGPFNATLGGFHIVGRVEANGRPLPDLTAEVGLGDLAVHSSAAGKHAMAVEHLELSGQVDAPIGPNPIAALGVRNGIVRCTTLSMGENRVNNLDVNWAVDGPKLTIGRLSAEIFDGTLTGAPSIDLATHEMSHGDFQIKSVDVHKLLANVSPEHLDAVGKATGAAHLALTSKGELSGVIDLAFDGPGTLRIGQIDEIKQMLVGNFGLDLANLAMHDLEHYPFREGALHLESAGQNSELKIKFVRQPKSAADVVSPHKEIINGREVLVGSLVVPAIDMTIPIVGQSLAEILAIVGGVHPELGSAGTSRGK
jgi:hypothetical protein